MQLTRSKLKYIEHIIKQHQQMFEWTEWPLLLLLLLLLLIVFTMHVLHCGWPTICIFNIIIRCRFTSEPTSSWHTLSLRLCALCAYIFLHRLSLMMIFRYAHLKYVHVGMLLSTEKQLVLYFNIRMCLRAVCEGRAARGHTAHTGERRSISCCVIVWEKEKKRERETWLRLCGWDRNQRACSTLCKIQRIQIQNMLFYVFGCFYPRFSFLSSFHYMRLVRMWMNFVDDFETESKRSVLVRYSMISDSMFPACT